MIFFGGGGGEKDFYGVSKSSVIFKSTFDSDLTAVLERLARKKIWASKHFLSLAQIENW